MSRRCGWIVGCVALLSLGQTGLAAEPAGKPELMEGTWTHRGGRTVIGAGSDETITVKKVGDGWTISFLRVTYPPRNGENLPVKETREGPFAVRVEDQELVITREKDKEPARYTFLCSPEQFIMPAIVQKKPGVWEHRVNGERLRVQCSDDPTKTPTGNVEVTPPILLGEGEGTYTFEQGVDTRLLHFFEQKKDGQSIERFQLIFDKYGWPRFEQLLDGGGRSSVSFQNRLYRSPAAER